MLTTEEMEQIGTQVRKELVNPDVVKDMSLEEIGEGIWNGSIPYDVTDPFYQENPLGILYAHTLGPYGTSALSMVNSTVGGLLAYPLTALGKGVELISPFSGEGQGGDSWLTSAAKGVLGVQNYFDDALTNYETSVIGTDPNLLQKVVKGMGSIIGFAGTGFATKSLAAAKGLPRWAASLLGGLASGGLEAVSETGGFMGDAYREGKFDNSLGAATKNLLTNLALNSILENTVGQFNPMIDNIINPVIRKPLRAIAEVGNELLQEPSQQVIERATKNSLNDNTDFIPELVTGFQNDWWNTFKEIGLETGLSALGSSLLFGAGEIATRKGRENLRRQYKFSQLNPFIAEGKDKDGNKTETLRIKDVDKAIDFARTEDVSNPNDPFTKAVYLEIADKRDNLQITLNEAGADMSDPNAMQNIQNIQNQIRELDDILDKFVPLESEIEGLVKQSLILGSTIENMQTELDNIPNQIENIYQNQAVDLDTDFEANNYINELQARQQELQARIPELQARKAQVDAKLQRRADFDTEQERKYKEAEEKFANELKKEHQRKNNSLTGRLKRFLKSITNNNDDDNQPPAPPAAPTAPTDIDDSQLDMFADYDDLIDQDNDNQNQDDDSEVASERNNLIRQIADFTRTHTDEEIAANPELSNQLNTMLNSLNELEIEARKQQEQQNSGTTMSLSEINANLAEYDELDKKINKAAQDIEAGRDVNRAEYEANLKRYNEIEKQLAQVDTSKPMPKINRKRINEIKQKRSAIDSHLSNMADKGAAWRAQNPDNAENLDVDNFLNSKPKPIEVENISNKLKAEREKIQKRVDKSSAILGTESDVDTQALSDLQDLQARISALNDKISKLENYNNNYSRQQNSNNNDANLVTPMADTQQNTTQTQQPKTTKSKRQVTVDENGEINLYPYSGRKGLLYTRKAELDVKLKNAKMNGDEAAVKEITEELQKIAEEIGDIIEADEYPVILQNAQYIMERNAYEAEHGECTFMSREEWDNLHPLSSYAEGARKIREAKRTGKAAAHKTNNDANLVTPMTDEQQTQKPKPMDKKSNPDLFIEKPSPAGVQADLVDMRNGLTDDEFKEFKEIIRRAKTENNPADIKRIREIFANARKRILTDDDGNPLGKRKSKKKSSKKSETQTDKKSQSEKKEKHKTNKELEQEAVKRATQNLDAETRVDDEPDPKLDEQTVSTDNDLSLDSVMRIVQEETGNQDSTGESYNQSYQNGVVNDDKDLFIGKFTFSTKGKKYSLNVIVQQEINDDRLSRLHGRAIELRNNNGEVIATYYPYTNEFEFHKTGVNHSQAWLNSFEAQFRQHLQEYMYNGGFIDAQGKFIKDGNEDFRERWKARNENDPDAIFSDEQEPEDFEKPREIATLRVTQNGQPRNFKIVTGEYTGKYQEQRRLFGRILNIYDENKKLVARYSPYTKILQFSAAYKSNSEIKSQITEQINKNRTTLLKAGNFLDENGKLKSDGNEEYRRKYIERQKNKGKKIKVRTIQGTEIEARYKIVEADDLIVSTLETGAPNPAYPQELQPRQRNREASHQQIAGMAANIDPELLAENRLVSDGAPVVGSDKVVESGNGRTLALKRAYKTNSAGNYKTWLRDNAKRFGYTAEDVDKFTNPVLVRERISDVDRVQFTREANDTSVSRMSTTETAMNDSKRITESMLLLYDPNKSLAANKDFINAFLKSIPQSERGEFLQKNGNVSKAGLFRIENALIAKAYNDISIMDRLSELIDDDIKNVSNALISAAPKIALLENLGNRPELSLRNDIMQAINILADLRQNSTKVAEYLAQIPMFADEDKVTPAAKKLLKFFDDNIRSAKKIAAGLINYAETAANEAKENQGTLPGMEDSKRSKENILSQAIKETYKQSAENGTDTDSDNNDSTKDKYEKLYDELEEKFTDENGVIDDDKVDEAFWKQVKEDAEGRRSIIDRAIDKLAKKYANAKRALSEKIDDIFVGIGDIFANDEDYRKVYKKVYLLFRNFHHHNFGRHAAAAIANVVATITRYYSRMTGVSQDDFFNNCGLKINFDKSREARYERDKDGNIIYHEYTDEYGRKHKSPKIEYIKGRYTRDTNIKLEPGSLFREADSIITLFEDEYRFGNYIEGSDVSTVIHEVLGHFQLNNLRTLYRNGQLKGTALQDFKTLIKWLGVSDLDLNKDYDQKSNEGKRWQDAHEKFAVGMEKYFREGNAPTKKLRHAFENIRRWLYGVYSTMSGMKYEGADGEMHEFTINDDVRRVFDNMFLDLEERRSQSEARRETGQGNMRKEGQPIVKEKAKSQVVTSDNEAVPEVQHTNALSSTQSLTDNSQSGNIEKYNQIIYPNAAKRLDEAENTTIRMDNLKIAKKLERKGKPAKSIWLATGWQHSIDDEWRMELNYGNLVDINKLQEEYNALKRKADNYEDSKILHQEAIDELLREISEDNEQTLPEHFWIDKISDLIPENEPKQKYLTEAEEQRLQELNDKIYYPKLSDIFDAPELYKAYPQLKDINIEEDWDMDEDKGFFAVNFNGNNFDEYSTFTINPRLNDKQKREILIYGIQYAIQIIENNSINNPNIFSIIESNANETDINNSKYIHKNLKRIAILHFVKLYRDLNPVLRKKINELMRQRKNLSPVKFNNLVKKTLKKSEREQFIKLLSAEKSIKKDVQINQDKIKEIFINLRIIANQAEARNAQTRKDWDESKRRTIPLSESENLHKQYNDTTYYENDNFDNSVTLKKGKARGDVYFKGHHNYKNLLDNLDISDDEDFAESYNQSALNGQSINRFITTENIEIINSKGKAITLSNFKGKMTDYRNTVARIQKDTVKYIYNVNSNPTFEEIKNALTKQYEAELRELEAGNGEVSRISALQERINFFNEISDIKITSHRSNNTHKNLTPELGHSEKISENTELVSNEVKTLPKVELINSEGENFTLDNVRGNNALAFPRVKHDIMRYLEEVRYNPSSEEIKRVLTERYEEEIKQVEAGNGKRKNSSTSKIQDRIRFLDKISDIRIIDNSQSGNIERYNQTLKQEAQTWSENVDKVLNGEFSSGAHIKVMETPRVFNLIGAKSLPIYMDADKINYVLTKHTALTPEIIKQIPTAISDPIAIFKSATHPNDSIIVMTELIDKDGGTIVVPVQLDVQQDSYQINRIASIYAKKNEKTGQVKNEWFSEWIIVNKVDRKR